MNIRPNTRAIDSQRMGQGTVRLTRASSGEYYVEVDLGPDRLYQSTDFDDFDKANEVFDRMVRIVGDLTTTMYAYEFAKPE